MRVQERTQRNADQLLEKDGFLANPEEPKSAELHRIIGEMPAPEYDSRIKNTSCHDLCDTPNSMPEAKKLLSLGLTFYLHKPVTEMDIPKTMKRVCKDVRWKYFFADRVEEEETYQGYIPGLYVKT